MNDPTLIVALSFLSLIAVVTLCAILRYKNVDDLIKLWSIAGPVVSLVLGAVVTYYFTKESHERQVDSLTKEISLLAASNKQKDESYVALLNENYVKPLGQVAYNSNQFSAQPIRNPFKIGEEDPRPTASP